MPIEQQDLNNRSGLRTDNGAAPIGTQVPHTFLQHISSYPGLHRNIIMWDFVLQDFQPDIDLKWADPNVEMKRTPDVDQMDLDQYQVCEMITAVSESNVLKRCWI